jgi:hypothetical protein
MIVRDVDLARIITLDFALRFKHDRIIPERVECARTEMDERFQNRELLQPEKEP